MNGYNVSMKGERSRDRDSFTFNPNVKLPDTVGMHKHQSKLFLKRIILWFM